MFSQVAVTTAIPVVGPGEIVTVATPELSVVADGSEMFPRFVSNVTCASGTGIPFRLMVAVIWAVSVEFAVIVVG